MSLDQFKMLCKKYWEPKYRYMVIDLSRDYESGIKYRNYI